MRSDSLTEPRPPRWMKTEKSGGETENNHQANYHTITAGSCPHPSLSDCELEWEHVWQWREENGGDYRQIRPQLQPMFPVWSRSHSTNKYRDALTKNKEKKRKIRNQEKHTKTKSERWRDFLMNEACSSMWWKWLHLRKVRQTFFV